MYGPALNEARSYAGAALWSEIEKKAWFAGGSVTPDGLRLLEVLRSFGPLATTDDKKSLIQKYPNGIDEERAAAGQNFERRAIRSAQETFLASWLADGLDPYERVVLELASGWPLPAAVLRRALEAGAFRAAYSASPASLSGDFLAAVGTLSPPMWSYVERQPWYGDGLSDAELTLLYLVSIGVGTSGEQLAILDHHLYVFVGLQEGDFTVVANGFDETKARAALEVVRRNLAAVEAYLGPYPQRWGGLWLEVDDKTRRGAECYARHWKDEPAEIFLASPECFEPGVMVHELTHTFFIHEYPTWFTEGVAELVAYHLTGVRTGYLGTRGKIDLDADLDLDLDDIAYYNQAGLGSTFLVAVYKAIGPEPMARFLAEVKARDMTGGEIVDTLLSNTPADKKAALRQLIDSSFRSPPLASR